MTKKFLFLITILLILFSCGLMVYPYIFEPEILTSPMLGTADVNITFKADDSNEGLHADKYFLFYKLYNSETTESQVVSDLNSAFSSRILDSNYLADKFNVYRIVLYESIDATTPISNIPVIDTGQGSEIVELNIQDFTCRFDESDYLLYRRSETNIDLEFTNFYSTDFDFSEALDEYSSEEEYRLAIVLLSAALDPNTWNTIYSKQILIYFDTITIEP